MTDNNSEMARTDGGEEDPIELPNSDGEDPDANEDDPDDADEIPFPDVEDQAERSTRNGGPETNGSDDGADADELDLGDVEEETGGSGTADEQTAAEVVDLESDESGGDPEPAESSEIDEQTESPPSDLNTDEGTTESSTGDERDDTQRQSRSIDERKWFLTGVGGAGNNLVDAVLLRKQTLEQRGDPLAQTWKSGLQGISAINTNRNELRETFFATRESERDRSAVAMEHQLGEGGAGFNEHDADIDVKEAFETGNPFTDISTLQAEEIQRAQATMLLHSAVKGTGSGATPRLAQQIKEGPLAEYERADRPLYSGVILPTEGRDYASFSRGVKVKNAAVSLARMSKHVDALIPFDNQKLEESRAEVNIENGGDWYSGYESANRSLVSFLEAFSMSSIPSIEEQSKELNNGEVFDVRDPFRPIADRNPLGFSPEEKPATILAPAHGWVRGDRFNETKLQQLLRTTLSQGKLADFDETTAWGGVFMFYGPAELMEEVRTVTRQSFLPTIAREELMDLRNADIDIDVGNLFYVVAPSTDRVHLWSILWNPEMQPVYDFCDYAMEQIEKGTDRGKRCAEFEQELDNLRNQLGHEPFRS